MSSFRKNALLSLGLLGFASFLCAQTSPDYGEIHGNVGIDAQYYLDDPAINTQPVPDIFRANSFLNLVYTRGNFRAGLRYEAYMPKPLLGFPVAFEGHGIPFRYAGYTLGRLDITAGNFYEQFGNGLILRSYEERALGFDNALDGVRLKYQPVDGLRLTGFIARQRFYWQFSPGNIKGFDAELTLREFLPKVDWKKWNLIVGGSFVSRYQSGQEIPNPDNPANLLEIPLNVGSFSGRMNLGYGGFQLNAEYAYKINDPNALNKFIYKPGTAAYVSAAYSTKGLGISLQAKRVENFDFRSDRNAQGNDLLLNFIPMLNKQHTYALPASIYPYAVQANSELGWQADVNFTTPKWLNKKYATTVNLNFSMVSALDTTPTGDRYGYTSSAFDFGKRYYMDANIEVQQPLGKKTKLSLMYMYLWQNQRLVQGQGTTEDNLIAAHIAVVDATWKVAKKHTLRFEVQHLATPALQNPLNSLVNGSWAMGLVEYNFNPLFFASVMNQWSYGNPDEKKQIHYPTAMVGVTLKTTRIAIGYGRQREGIICIGGVCRQVPASNGLTFSLMSSF